MDVRTAPGSRRHPHVGREQLETWLPTAGIRYRWERRLGGWRKAGAGSPNGGLRNASFRGYADWMATAEFGAALDLLVEEAGQRPTAAMCSEAVWWRCHRRLLADAAVLLRGLEVLHLGHDGNLTLHPPTPEAVRTEIGGRPVLRYPPAAGDPRAR